MNVLVRALCYTVPAQHHDIHAGQLPKVEAKALADQAFYAIAIHGTASILFRYGETQSGSVRTVGSPEHSQAGVRGSIGLLENAPISGRLQ